MTGYKIPAINDSFIRVIIDGRLYWFRFTYNVQDDSWTFGLWKGIDTLIFATKIVPNFPLNVYFSSEDMPDGYFFALTEVAEKITKYSFSSGEAFFAYVPMEELEGA